MKKIVLNLSTLLSTVIFSNELAWVDHQVDAIKPSRVGMQSATINSIKDPFIFLEKNRTSERKGTQKTLSQKFITQKKSIPSNKQEIKNINKILVLNLVMNNSAMISGEWYKLGDSVNGFKVSEINRNSVLLYKHKKKLLLSTKSNTNKLKFLNK